MFSAPAVFIVILLIVIALAVGGIFALLDELFEKARDGRTHRGGVLDYAAKLREQIPRRDNRRNQAALIRQRQCKAEIIPCKAQNDIAHRRNKHGEYAAKLMPQSTPRNAA